MADPVVKRFAENLSRHRERAGLSQEELASRAEIHRTQIGALLNGKQLPRLDTVIKLAGALSITPAELIEGITFEPADQTGQFKLTPVKRAK